MRRFVSCARYPAHPDLQLESLPRAARRAPVGRHPKGPKWLSLDTRSSSATWPRSHLPIFGVDSKINVGFFGYLQTLSLWGRTANVLVELPYIWGMSKGIVEGVPRRRDVSPA